MTADLKRYIDQRRRELNAVILAHFYQRPEIQELADFTGDSLQLARQASRTSAGMIFFCGVSFMAESAKILNPERRVFHPEARAGCPMADMITGSQLREWKKSWPGLPVVCYVNSSAEVKAESDICCTSSNAAEVVESLGEAEAILFVPDQNLGHYVGRLTGRRIITWPGYCPVHHQLNPETVLAEKEKHPGALVLVHPECRPAVVDIADRALSTGGILDFVEQSGAREFIIGTEEGLLYQLRKRFPSKNFYLARKDFICPEMKLTKLDTLAQAMRDLKNEVNVPGDIRVRAYQSLEKMLQIG